MTDKIDKEKYKFYPYNKKYPEYFENEKLKLKKLFPNSIIEHIGSTAVPGLGGKGIIDIMILDNHSKKNLLEQNDYVFSYNGGTDERLFFSKHSEDYKVHIHLIKKESDDWKQKLFFRDFLRKNPDKSKEYEEIKKKACDIAQGSREKYQKHKQEFILSILEKMTSCF